MIILLFIAVLLVTVIVHEWGHFFAARKSGMIVEEFGFGIPPRIVAWKKGRQHIRSMHCRSVALLKLPERMDWKKLFQLKSNSNQNRGT